MATKKEKTAEQLADTAWAYQSIKSIPEIMEKLSAEEAHGASPKYIENVLKTVNQTIHQNDPHNARLLTPKQIENIHDALKPFATEPQITIGALRSLYGIIEARHDFTTPISPSEKRVQQKIAQTIMDKNYQNKNALQMMEQSHPHYSDEVYPRTSFSFKTIGKRLQDDIKEMNTTEKSKYIHSFFSTLLSQRNLGELKNNEKNELVDALAPVAKNARFYSAENLKKLETKDNKAKLQQMELDILSGGYGSEYLMTFALTRTDIPQLQTKAIKMAFSSLSKSSSNAAARSITQDADKYARQNAYNQADTAFKEQNSLSSKIKRAFSKDKQPQPTMAELEKKYLDTLKQDKTQELTHTSQKDREKTYIINFLNSLNNHLKKHQDINLQAKEAIATGIDGFLREGHGYFNASKKVLATLGMDKTDVSKKKTEIKEKLEKKYNKDISDSVIEIKNDKTQAPEETVKAAKKIIKANENLERLHTITGKQR